ncbi:MAG: asparagine synthase-related protein [Chloroflexota bacterium]
MSGIFGYASGASSRSLHNRLPTMQQAFSQQTPTICHRWSSPSHDVGLAMELPDRLNFKHSGYLAVDESIVCVVDGIIFQDAENGHPESAESNPAQRLLEVYSSRGISGLKDVSGSFVVAFWHKTQKKLVLATDKIGYRHLFYAQDGENFFFSSFLARIPQMLSKAPQIDEEAFADLLTYRHVLGERTLLKQIKLVPVGTAIIFENNQLRSQPYWHCAEIEPRGHYNSERLDELIEAFLLAVKRSFQPERTALLTLTGGVDSRTILAAAAHQRLNFVTLTDGNPLGTDAQIARLLSTHLGIPHYSQPVYTHLLGQLLRPMAQQQSGLIATIDSHPCQYIQAPLPGEIVVSGITGETARSPWVEYADLSHNNLDYAMKLVNRAVLSPLASKLDLKTLWQSPYQAVGSSAAQEHMAQLMGGYQYPDSPLMAADYYGLDEHTRKFLNKGSLIALSNMEVMIPYIDHEWVEAIMSVPLAERVSNNIQLDMIKRLYPALLKLPYSKTMLPLDAAKWRTNLSQKARHYREKASRKLGNGRYRREVPTHNYLEWSRGEMRSSLEATLLNPQAAYRTFLNPDKVTDMLHNHFNGKQNWPHLVAALTTLEFTHNLWVDNNN